MVAPPRREEKAEAKEKVPGRNGSSNGRYRLVNRASFALEGVAVTPHMPRRQRERVPIALRDHKS